MQTGSGDTNAPAEPQDGSGRALQILAGFRKKKEEERARATLLHIRLGAGPNGYAPRPEGGDAA